MRPESDALTNVPVKPKCEPRAVLLTHRRGTSPANWVWCADGVNRVASLDVCRAYSGAETVDRVTRGGLAAAVLVADSREIDGLSLLRMIRGINDELPCWLVTESATRPMLQSALSLRATSVFVSPFDPDELWFAVRRFVCE